MLINNLGTEQCFYDVLHGHKAGRSAIFIFDQCNLRLTVHEQIEQRIEVCLLRNALNVARLCCTKPFLIVFSLSPDTVIPRFS